MNEELKRTLDDARCDLEEANEGGDLEERLEAAQKVAALEARCPKPGTGGGPAVAGGACIVCGSALVLTFWRGHPDNKKIHCNDCGSEVTAWMHAKEQPGANIRHGKNK